MRWRSGPRRGGCCWFPAASPARRGKSSNTDVQAVDYVELDPLILALGKRYLPANLADGRIRVINTDGRLFVKQTREKYDVAIIDVPAPATAQLNRFYTVEFLEEVKRVLARDGVVCFALGSMRIM